MTHLRKLVSVVCSVLLSANLLTHSNAQQVDSETGNIVYTTVNPAPTSAQGSYVWNGFVPGNTQPGGFSGGNVPAYNTTTGTFIFGYAQGTINYAIAVNAAMAAAGTGIQVNGFKYSWNYYNQDYNRGTLTGNISLTNSAGSVIESYNYLMPKTTDGWTSISGIQNFNNQYAVPSLGNLNVSFTGKDDRFWAGYYGPQIKDIDVRFLYSAGSQPPTENNPACTSYSTDAKCVAQNVNSSTSSPTTTVSTTNDAITPTTVSSIQPTTVSTSSPTIATQEIINPTPTTTQAVSTPTISTTTLVSATPVVSATPTAINPQPKVGEVQTSSAPVSTQKSTVSTSQILTSIANEQSRIANVEKTVVQEAVQQATAAGTKAQLQAETVAAQAQAQSIAASNAQQNSSSLNQTGGDQRTQTQNSAIAIQKNNPTVLASINASKNQSNENQQITQQVTQQVTTNNFALGFQQFQLTKPQEVTALNTIPSIQLAATRTQQSVVVSTYVPEVSYPVMPEIISKQTFDYEIKNENSKTLERNNIIDMATQRNITEDTSNKQAIGPSVKRDTKDNDAAGGVSIESIAKQPANYAQYFTMIPDVAFYEPKEIYKNQRTVDNVRALRGLTGGSDRLHQEMVNQQYRTGN